MNINDILMLLSAGTGAVLGLWLIAQPDYHAARGKGAFAKPGTVRLIGIVCVSVGVLLLVTRFVLKWP